MSVDPQKETRPWGFFETFTKNDASTVKILTINPGQAFSLQYHSGREEFWLVLSGAGVVTVGDKTYEAKPGDRYTVPVGAKHRIEAASAPVRVLEISTGEFSEDDIVQLDDKYGRIE